MKPWMSQPQAMVFKAILALSMVVCLGASLNAAALYVSTDSPNPAAPYVDWSRAAHSIQDAVDAAEPGDTVLVAEGIYKTGGRAIGSILTNRVFIDRPVTVQSVMGPERTVIAGAPAPGGGHGDGAVRCAHLVQGAVLSGFTLTMGHTLGDVVFPLNPFFEGSGGGAMMDGDSKLINCIVRDNSADFFAGGVRGGLVERCVFKDNSADVGGAAAYSVISKSILKNNFALSGGGAVESHLYNSLIIRNEAVQEGGGVEDCELYNCTVVGNSARMGGGVSAGFVVVNSIVIGNQAQIGPNHNGAPDYDWSYTCTTPLYPGSGNIDTPPTFVNAAAGNYRLAYGSAGIDAGSDLSALLIDDFDGRPRPLDGDGDSIATFDMGAYEFDLPDIISPDQALERCVKLVKDSRLAPDKKRHLLIILKAAAFSLDRGNFRVATQILNVLQNLVRAQIMRDNPAQGKSLIDCARDAITKIKSVAASSGDDRTHQSRHCDAAR